VRSLAVDPGNTNVLYATDDSSIRGVLTSTDGGTSFTRLGLDVWTGVIVRVSPSVLLAGTLGAGVYRSSDGGATWAAPTRGLTQLAINGVAASPTSPSLVFAATDGGGLFRSMDRGSTWTRQSLPPPTLCSVTIDPSTPSVVYAVSDRDGVYKSADAGQTWQQIRNPAASFFSCGSFPQLVRVTVNPHNSQSLYLTTYESGSGLFRSTDAGTTWSKVSGVPAIVYDLAFDPRNALVLWAVNSASPAPLLSTDGGQTFTAVTVPFTDCCDRTPRSIVVTAAGTAIVGISAGDDVYRSSDAGRTWSRVIARSISAGLGAVLSLDPAGTVAYAALWRTTKIDALRGLDDGMTWAPYGKGLDSVTLVAREL
jgi:photosystem II stability/assembly factor-like uncharacterized protein